jgi:hypothetical protein
MATFVAMTGGPHRTETPLHFPHASAAGNFVFLVTNSPTRRPLKSDRPKALGIRLCQRERIKKTGTCCRLRISSLCHPLATTEYPEAKAPSSLYQHRRCPLELVSPCSLVRASWYTIPFSMARVGLPLPLVRAARTQKPDVLRSVAAELGSPQLEFFFAMSRWARPWICLGEPMLRRHLAAITHVPVAPSRGTEGEEIIAVHLTLKTGSVLPRMHR